LTPAGKPARSVDEYIAACPPEVRPILRKVRAAIRRAVPDAQETISYRMPTFTRHGVVLHFAAFREHIGLYPPVRGDAALMAEIAPYAGEKGNLRLPLDRKIPYGLIGRLAKARARRNAERSARRRPKGTRGR
jgi:uncharacterized protein YdhG (YjbR/CyaY superfamily)